MHDRSQQVRYTFKKFEILRSKVLIKELFENGSSFFIHPFKAFAARTDRIDHNQVLLTVSKKNFKHAVKRNAIKRKMREAYRLNKHLLTSDHNNFSYCIAIIYISKDVPAFQEVDAKLKALLARLNEARGTMKAI